MGLTHVICMCVYIYIYLSLFLSRPLSLFESWFSWMRFLSRSLIFSLFFLVLHSKGWPNMKQNFVPRLQCHGQELHRRQCQQGQQQSSCGCSIACRFGGLRGSPQLQRLEGGWRSEHEDGRTVKLLDIIFNRPQEHEEPSDPLQVPKIPSVMALFALLVPVPLWSETPWLWRRASNLWQMAPLVFTLHDTCNSGRNVCGPYLQEVATTVKAVLIEINTKDIHGGVWRAFLQSSNF